MTPLRITVVTLFPEMFDSVLAASVFGKAVERGQVVVEFVNPRDFAFDAHRSVDDAPYGGGPGMVMKCDQLIAAIESIAKPGPRIFLSPVGAPLTQAKVRRLAAEEHLVLVCGRYEGIDERVVELGIDESISIGDYVLTGGELGAMVLMDAVARYVPGVLGAADSVVDESFSSGLLEYPQYTRPPEFRGQKVPEILFSGHHANIEQWRRQKSVQRTAQFRPDLLSRQPELLKGLAGRTYVVLAHHPVLDRNGETVTTSVTNLDLHDIARSCLTYGLAGVYVTTPVALQRQKVQKMVATWQEDIDQAESDARKNALGLVQVVDSIDSALTQIGSDAREKPWVVATSAKEGGAPVASASQLRGQTIAESRPLVLVFGTGWGLHPEVLAAADLLLAPICGPGSSNHLSVRSAVVIVLDRLFAKGFDCSP